MAWYGGKGGTEKACTGSLRPSREHCMPLALEQGNRALANVRYRWLSDDEARSIVVSAVSKEEFSRQKIGYRLPNERSFSHYLPSIALG